MRAIEKDFIGQWLVEHLVEIIGCKTSEISWDDSFADLGLSSSEATGLAGEFERWLETELPVELFFDHRSIREVVEHVSTIGNGLSKRSFSPKPAALPAQEPIAIVGMSCRFPGAQDLEGFWELLSSGTDAIAVVPSERWNLDDVYDPVAGTPGKMNTRHGGFISDIEEFDAAAFGIAPREAERMDPQQRAMLEIAWEAFEDAGLNRQAVRGAPIGVFVGLSNQEYRDRQFSDRCSIDAYAGTGNSASIAANRISHFFDLRGPSLSIDTACSSSLTAIHMACQSLRSGESKIALVGAVNLMLSPEYTIVFSQAGLLSPDGKCRTFDADANGYVRGEGAAALILKPYSKAQEDGDRVYGLIRGSAINQDGRTLALTSPNREAQEAMLTAAYEAAGISPGEVDYVEAHGTATPIGDVIEVAALSSVLQQGRSVDNKCLIGSVKTNIGHLEAAAGMAGVIKTVLSMKHRQIPASLNFEQPNQRIGFEKTPVRVVTSLTPWPETSRLPLAGVSAFGFGGTNVHVVLEAVPTTSEKEARDTFRAFPVSARTANGLERACGVVEQRLQDGGMLPLDDLAYTLTKREVYDYRAVAVSDAAQGSRPVFAKSERVLSADILPAFVFAGVGDHYLGMGQGLYQAEPVFRHWVDYCCDWLKRELDTDLLDVFQTRPSREATASDAFRRAVGGERDLGILAQTELAQPAVFILEYALARLLEAWGVVPGTCVGYSLGEYTAATLAGVFSLEDGLRIVATRARLIDALPAGAMLAVPLGVEALGEYLDVDADLAVGIVNGPRLSVVSGPLSAIDVIQDRLQADGVISRRLGTSHAFHSPMMQPAAKALADLIDGMTLSAPRVPILSNVTGDWLRDEEATSSAYWARHLCETVQFSDCLAKLLEPETGALIEIGPGQSLNSLARLHPDFSPERSLILSTCRGAFDPEEDQAVFLKSLGGFWCAGGSVNWKNPFEDAPGTPVSLPSWLFDRQRYWIESRQPDVSSAQGDEGKIADIGKWFYGETWTEASQESSDEDAAKSNWLVLFADTPAGEALRVDLPGGSTRFVTTEVAKDPKRLQHALAEMRKEGFVPDRIVHLGALKSEEDFEAVQASGYHSLLALMRALGESRISTPIQLDIVSSGLYAALKEDAVSAAKATMIGAIRTVPQEYQNVTVRSIDVDDAGMGRLLAELLSPVKDLAVACRGDIRLVQHYESEPLEEVMTDRDALRQGGVYVITGGLGNVGLTVAGMLAHRYAARVVLLSRRSFPEREQWGPWLADHDQDDPVSRQIAKLLDMEAAGGEVVVQTADVSDEAKMGEVFAWIDQHYGQVHGVFHAAGLITAKHNKIIAELTTEQIDAHFDAKVRGTQILSRLLETRDADFCLVFSSISAVLGGLTLSAYVAANAFEDNFVLSRRNTAGTRWVSVNWDAWARDQGEQDNKGTTLEAFLMWPDEGVEAVRRVLGASRSPRLINSTGDLWARLEQWVYRKAEPTEVGKTKRKISHYARPAVSTAYIAANSEIEKRVARVFQDVLGIEAIGLEDNFFELGGNSLVSLQILAELQREFDMQLSPILIFEAPSIRAVSQHLASLNGGEEQAPTAGISVRRRRKIRSDSSASAIAIIGMATRCAGAPDIATLWGNALNGVESLTRFSDEELRGAGIAPDLVSNPNYVKIRGIVSDIDLFDAGVFGISPREAELMDPQHRLMLETAWETLEHAGYDSHRYDGAVGVFAGTTPSEYQASLFADRALWKGLNGFDTYLANTQDSLATRISYKLDLKGPSLSVGTYCSTSGVAIHLACQSLRAGESDMALAGGISLSVPNHGGYLYEPGNQASPDGHTRTFDARAQGTVFCDGVGMVLLKRLEDAIEDGDTIHAVIRGTAINNDGSLKAGYTAPSVEQQAEVVSLALENAGLSAEDIHYVEAHGTATELGDPIEVAALTKAYRESTDKVGYCALGSIKPNIGHTDRAAGVIGVIKATHVLKSGHVPPTLHFERPNPKIDLANSPFIVSNQRQELPVTDSPWRAGVTTLGVGGTNVHFILEEAPEVEPSSPSREA
ncbi:SDR family oxidoreductase, partial [Oleiagrimonas citrea]